MPTVVCVCAIDSGSSAQRMYCDRKPSRPLDVTPTETLVVLEDCLMVGRVEVAQSYLSRLGKKTPFIRSKTATLTDTCSFLVPGAEGASDRVLDTYGYIGQSPRKLLRHAISQTDPIRGLAVLQLKDDAEGHARSDMPHSTPRTFYHPAHSR